MQFDPVPMLEITLYAGCDADGGDIRFIRIGTPNPPKCEFSPDLLIDAAVLAKAIEALWKRPVDPERAA